MLSPAYYAEESPFELVPGVIRSRSLGNREAQWFPTFLTNAEREGFFRRHLPVEGDEYLLMVSTIEPRKNHLRLIAAWESLRAIHDKRLKLVIVGTLGWDVEQTMRSLKPWLERGEAFLLEGVPSAELRVLYRHASVTVCPSLGEGFDFSGVEAMASLGLVVASDLPVHREVYEDAALYFDPYSTRSLVSALSEVLRGANRIEVSRKLRSAGAIVVPRYQPSSVLPQWNAFLRQVMESE